MADRSRTEDAQGQRPADGGPPAFSSPSPAAQIRFLRAPFVSSAAFVPYTPPPTPIFVIPDEVRSTEIGNLMVAAGYEWAYTLMLPIVPQASGSANAHPARFRLSRAAWPARPE
ncbi:hypothetical protein ODE01S_22850 [Oceanithermus desulfurans NBRC 100063]|uniref:Uncharacterized protein n=1 Tax=Oceanithermus desulfurans NBRC 100063 TaxID=1227550 RepID=A0A511RMG2_9DEIN|nr:hypothetical protein ODE01S_22850 [Oceanithermus desulfurans NBRC 100063]